MNHLKRLLCLCALLLTPALFATEPFSGKITFAMSKDKGTPTAMTQTMKGTAVRIESAGAPGAIIMDSAKGEMIILMNDQGIYMVQPIKTADLAKKAKDTAAPEKTVEVTGQTEKILGYTCKQILIKDDKGVTEMWVSDAIGAFAGFGNPSGGGGGGGLFGKKKASAQSTSGWEQALKNIGGFPIRVVMNDNKGNETYRMEVTNIEKGGVTEKDFLPPEDFKKFEMPDMGSMNPFR
jgi:hypothetical protein